MIDFKLWLCLGIALVGVCGQQGGQFSSMREKLKQISGGGAPPPTRPPPPRPVTPYMEIIYSEPKLDGPYLSNAKWNARGMGELYSIVRIFYGWILNNQAYPESLISVQGQNVQFGDPSTHWEEWLKFYSGPVAIIGIGVIFIILLPIIGLFFCCCRCAGKCGTRTTLEKRHDSCRRGTLATFLLAIAVVILFGVVCAYVTNEQIKEGTEGLIDSARTSLKDSELYLKNAKTEVDNLLIANFKQLENQLNSLLADTGRIVSDQLANASHAVVLSNLTEMAAGLEVVKNDLRDISITTREVQKTAGLLSEALDQTRSELLDELDKCRAQRACRELLQLPQIRELRVLQNFTQLPDVSRTFESIRELVGSGSVNSIQQQVLEGQRSLDHIKNEVTASVQSHIPYVTSSLEHTGEQLEAAADKIKRTINEVQNLLNKLPGQNLDRADAYIDEYGIYRYYLGLGISSAILLILLCISFGLLCGICGKRPEDHYSDDADFCTTLAGGRFLMVAVWLMFLLGSVMMVLTLALFLLGTAAQTGICRPLNDSANDQIFKIVDQFVKFDDIYQGKRVDISLSKIITDCHANKSMYTTFKLENVFNIEEVLNYKRRYQVEEQIARFKNQVIVRTDRVQLLSPAARQRLIDLAESPVNDIQFSRYTEQLSASLTNINLNELAEKLLNHADQIPQTHVPNYNLTKTRQHLRAKAQFLELLQQSRVTSVQEGVAALKANVTNLKRHLKFNHTSLRAAVAGLLTELDAAQQYLVINGTAHMRLLVDEFAKEYTDYVDEYLHRVVDKTKQDIGRCGVLSNVYNSTKVAGCNRVVDPFNGFWTSVGWCLLLFLPAIILSVKLSSLYQKCEAYAAPGNFPESEILYDAYADRDNMPLAVSHGDKKHNHHRSYQETYDNGSGAYMQDYSAHLSRAERANGESRFSDIAPKQWDPRSPPRYPQPPSTEYERPPPYYYPGPGERA